MRHSGSCRAFLDWGVPRDGRGIGVLYDLNDETQIPQLFGQTK
jgi:hypothetical protein